MARGTAGHGHCRPAQTRLRLERAYEPRRSNAKKKGERRGQARRVAAVGPPALCEGLPAWFKLTLMCACSHARPPSPINIDGRVSQARRQYVVSATGASMHRDVASGLTQLSCPATPSKFNRPHAAVTSRARRALGWTRVAHTPRPIRRHVPAQPTRGIAGGDVI